MNTTNDDTSRVPAWTARDPLARADGSRVRTPAEWDTGMRTALLRHFEDHVYGHLPPGLPGVFEVEVLETCDTALDGTALRRQVRLHFREGPRGAAIDVLAYLPAHRTGPCPAFLGLNFGGNHTVHPDPALRLPRSWVYEQFTPGCVDDRATEASRGFRADQWPVPTLLARGFALVTAYAGDLAPDSRDRWRDGVLALRPDHPTHDGRADGDAGAVALWAWGVSRLADFAETLPEVDSARLAVVGHSRLGKAALWAGARDTRLGVVISNNSGAGGAKLAARGDGEGIADLARVFPHWFAPRYLGYAGREQDLPVDQHQLLALVAPRALYVASASEDGWADPLGELLSLVHAGPVFALHGRRPLSIRELPEPGSAVSSGHVGYHLRPGPHAITRWDWDHYLRFAEGVFGMGPPQSPPPDRGGAKSSQNAG